MKKLKLLCLGLLASFMLLALGETKELQATKNKVAVNIQSESYVYVGEYQSIVFISVDYTGWGAGCKINCQVFDENTQTYQSAKVYNTGWWNTEDTDYFTTDTGTPHTGQVLFWYIVNNTDGDWNSYINNNPGSPVASAYVSIWYPPITLTQDAFDTDWIWTE